MFDKFLSESIQQVRVGSCIQIILIRMRNTATINNIINTATITNIINTATINNIINTATINNIINTVYKYQLSSLQYK